MADDVVFDFHGGEAASPTPRLAGVVSQARLSSCPERQQRQCPGLSAFRDPQHVQLLGLGPAGGPLPDKPDGLQLQKLLKRL